MDHPLLGTIEYQRKHREWTGRLPLPAMADWRVRSRLNFGEIESCEDEDPDPENDPSTATIEVTILDEKGTGRSAEQNAALQYLVQESEVYARAILHELARTVRYRLADERPGEHEPEERARFDEAAQKLRLDTPEGVKQLVELGGIYVLEDHKAGQSYLTFEFACGWDEEHGASVLVHAGNALTSGAAAEFRSPIDEHVEYMRDSDAERLSGAPFPSIPSTSAQSSLTRGCTWVLVQTFLMIAGIMYLIDLLLPGADGATAIIVLLGITLLIGAARYFELWHRRV